MKSVQQQQEERRQRQLDDIRRQVENGTLVIRQMTAEERRMNPPKPRAPKPVRRRGQPA
jgi:hypothetical protein